MFEIFRNYQRYNEITILGLSSIICFSLSAFRAIYSKSTLFLFLNWNLFLAFVPWLLSVVVLASPRLKRNPWMAGALFCGWLLFFPNAPYILTDLFHLSRNLQMPIWFDLVLILSISWTGLLFGFLSLRNIEAVFIANFNVIFARVLSVGLLFVASFGVYLGRYLRWNSWDLLTKPEALLGDILAIIVFPMDHATPWGMTIFLGIFLNMTYWTLRLLTVKKSA